MKNLIRRASPLLDLLLAVLVIPSAILLKGVRSIGVSRLPLCKKVLLRIGVFPIRDHYYEPLFNPAHLAQPLNKDRELPGINWNTEEQIALLNQFRYAEELENIPVQSGEDLVFQRGNSAFMSGDFEYWYQLIRLKKPRRIIEIGSGNSTLIAVRAIQKNKEEDSGYTCEHICVEPYEMPWLEKTGVKVIRKKVEEMDPSFFLDLQENDILFIDSSHMIRPQGDVLYEYLNLLPRLNRGVIVHIHDIFSPGDYIEQWVVDQVFFWNEQYLLEAFLTSNGDWKIIGALNYLHHHHYEQLARACPYLTPDREPGSFYIQKVPSVK